MTTKPTSETEIFQAAANLPAEERGPFLDRACGDNQPLRREIESLLKAHDPDGSFLQSPALAATVDRPEVNQTIDEQPGSMIGPYKIREKIGEGGFGVVYVAEQEQPVRRKVALKVIKPGMDSREIVARFEAERQALALMDHPHIAKILDASTTASGRPYFVMELVRGVLITDYCNAQKLPTKQRLELFIQICHAVQHAHQKGVVHRDLKPSNVLVAPHDGVPVVKVIDFGVAKALGQQLTDKSIYTRFASMIGTPLYMSPEQAEINALDVDTRSDVYSLGVLLYELLTGTTPFDRKKLESAAFDEMRRIIREEMPESPSARVTTLTHESKAIAASHGVDSGNLAKIIRGDLDVIVMKALEKERGRRYDTASAFAEDIGRYLNQEPILAKPASTAYRFKKFAQRNRGAMLTGSLIAVSLLLATVVSTLSAIAAGRSRNEALASAAEAMEARSQAERSAQEARTAQQAETLRAEEASVAKLEAEARQAEASATLNFLTNKLLANSDPGINFLDMRRSFDKSSNSSPLDDIAFDSLAFTETASNAISDAQNPTVLELLDRAAAEVSEERIEVSFPKQPNVKCAVLHTIAQCYQRLNKPDKALPFAERAAQLAKELYGPNDVRTIRALLLLARSHSAKGQVGKGKSIAKHALEISKAQFGENDEVSWVCMAALCGCIKVRQYQDSEFLALHGKILSHLQGADIARLSNHEILTDLCPEGWPEFLATVLTTEANLQMRAGSHVQANELAEKAHAIIAPRDGVETPASLTYQARLGQIKRLSGDLEGATKILEATLASMVKIYGKDHPRTLRNQLDLAEFKDIAKDYDSALKLMNEIRPSYEVVFKDDSQQLFLFWHSLAAIQFNSGSYDQAIELRKNMCQYAAENEGLDVARVLDNQRFLADAYFYSKRYREAISSFEESLPRCKELFGEHDARTIQQIVRLAECQLHIDATAEARPWLDQARALCNQHLEPENPQTLINEFNYGWYYEKLGDYSNSVTCYEAVQPRWMKVYASNTKQRIKINWNMGISLEKCGRVGEALQAYQQYYAAAPKEWHRDAEEVHYKMIQAYLANKHLEQAIAIVPSLVETSRDLGNRNPRISITRLDNTAKLLMENSQTAAAIPLLEEAIRLQEDTPGPSGKSSADSPLKTGARLIALANQRDKLIDAYLATNRENDARTRVLGWIEQLEKPEARSLLAALRVVRGHIKSEQHDLAKSLLVQLEAATKRGVSSDSDAVLTKLAMPNDVKQLSLLCEIGSQYLALREYVSAGRLCRECIDEYTRVEQKGRFVLPTLKKQAQYILGCALLEQSKYSEAEPLLLASLLSEEELSDGADSTAHKAAIAALEKLYIATDRSELAQKWRAKP